MMVNSKLMKGRYPWKAAGMKLNKAGMNFYLIKLNRMLISASSVLIFNQGIYQTNNKN